MTRGKISHGAGIPAIGALAALFVLAGCSFLGDSLDAMGDIGFPDLWGESEESERIDVLWKVGNQFVRLEPQDLAATGAPAPNAHPENLSQQWIGGSLRLISVRRAPGDQPAALFTEENVGLLGKYLSEGLAIATPNQDVTFAVLRKRGPVRLEVTTGRVFYAGGDLNLIFGSILRDATWDGEDYEEIDDPREVSYVPGRRAGVRQTAVLMAPQGSGIYMARGANRNDWLVISPRAAAAQRPAAYRPPQYGQPQYGQPQYGRPPYGRQPQYGQPPYGQPQYGAYPPRQQYPATRQQAPAPYPRPGAPPGAQTVEQRLALLENLRQKGLISEEEYQAKRNKILQGF